MMPIVAWAPDFALFALPAFFAAIFFPLLSPEGRSFSKFHSPRKMDPSCGPRPLPPIPQAAPRRPLRPWRVPPNAIRAVQSNDSSNARRVFSVAVRSIQNVSETSQRSRPTPQYPYFRKPPCELPEDASRRAALPATASLEVVAQADPPLRDLLCSKQKCRQSPSVRLSCFECHRQARAPAPPVRTLPVSQYQFHLVPRRRSRSARASSLPHPEAAPPPPSSARARQGILSWPSTG